MINAKLQNLYNIKNDIGTAIVNKGGTITESTPFYSYAGQIDSISTGTPQTVFQDSTGAKWARTNVVNLVNDAGNVTSDFNWWQPSNNTTSDAILNVGTVNGNISGNIRIVQVNQVNIAQYVNLVATAINGAKFVGFNGYDSQTNPTPTGNTTFNRWLLNNSATGTVLFANATIVNGGTFNGPNSTSNITNMAFINNTVSVFGNVTSLTTNNGFIYAGRGVSDYGVRKYHESNLVLLANLNTSGGIFALTTNNGFIYVGGASNETVRKYHESNLAFVAASNGYGAAINAVTVNNGFVYAGGRGFPLIRKWHESNLVFSGNSPSYGGNIRGLTTNNGYIYAVGEFGSGNGIDIRKYHESNLSFVSNSARFADTIETIAINNGFIYIGGVSNQTVHKYHESNLAFVGATASYGGTVQSITTNNGFIYVGGQNSSGANRTVQKYYESNLAFVANTANYGGTIFAVTANNGFVYAGGAHNNTVNKYQEQGVTLESLTFYTATKIKE
jgi:hypothetical protein